MACKDKHCPYCRGAGYYFLPPIDKDDTGDMEQCEGPTSADYLDGSYDSETGWIERGTIANMGGGDA